MKLVIILCRARILMLLNIWIKNLNDEKSDFTFEDAINLVSNKEELVLA